MPAQPLNEVVEAGWAEALAPVAGRIAAMGEFLRGEIAAGRTYLPAGKNILRAFQQPLDEVKVLIVGQDPYPTPGMAIGLSFAVAPEVRRLPGSLVNIYRELQADLGVPQPSNGDLTPWTRQGVLLLNRALTTAPGSPAAHRGKGLGRGHRAGDPRSRRARQAPRLDPVGPRRPQPAPAPRGLPRHRVGPPLPDVRRPRLLRLPPLQPRQRPAPQAGRPARGLAPSVAPGAAGRGAGGGGIHLRASRAACGVGA
ncbi:uracil-DNA glycosylase [Streptomyces sp. SolWspMP-sol7th]|nr:uracil-DNA glycosylase [Streptomyces sp. SolWspMP-sol7th]